jgi:hypothetical protein
LFGFVGVSSLSRLFGFVGVSSLPPRQQVYNDG